MVNNKRTEKQSRKAKEKEVKNCYDLKSGSSVAYLEGTDQNPDEQE